jgi:hypothetical protein
VLSIIAVTAMVAVFRGHSVATNDNIVTSTQLHTQGGLLLVGSSVSKGWKSHDPAQYPKYWGWCQRVASALAVTQGLELKQLSVAGSDTVQWTDANNAQMGAQLLKGLQAKPKLLLVGLSLGNQGITTTADYTAAAAVGEQFVNGLRKLAELGHSHGVPVVFGGVYGNADFQKHQTLVTYQINDRLKAEVPTWTGNPSYIEFLPSVVQCHDRNVAACGRWPTSVSNPGHNYQYNYAHPDALGCMAMYRAIDFKVFNSLAPYNTDVAYTLQNSGSCVSHGAIQQYAGDLDKSQVQWSGNPHACRALCTKLGDACKGYDFAISGQGDELMSLTPSVERRCRIHTGEPVSTDGNSNYVCYAKGVVHTTVAPTPPPAAYAEASGGCRNPAGGKVDGIILTGMTNVGCIAACKARKAPACVAYEFKKGAGVKFCEVFNQGTSVAHQNPSTFKSWSYKYKCGIQN